MTFLPAFDKNMPACVIGWPVAHSKSPLIHTAWMQHYGIAGRYGALAIAPDQLVAFFKALPESGMKGCNVTVPHKEETLNYMHTLDACALKAGAVNTVLVGADGTLEGRNTDVAGFTANLESAGRAWKKRKPALIVGAGGAARAVIVALNEAGCEAIKITNRTLDRARDLIADMKSRDTGVPLELVAWQDREDAANDVGLLVNTTTQGMTGQAPLDFNLKSLKEEALVTDLVYTPLITPLLAEARRRSHRIVDGLGMLLYQAAPAFEAWFGVMPDVTQALRDKVIEALRVEKP